MRLRFGKFSDRRAWIAAQEQRKGKEKGGGWGTRGGGGSADSSYQQPAATTTAHPQRARLVMNLTTCSVGWWLMAGAGLF
jgi:hypothetical protein